MKTTPTILFVRFREQAKSFLLVAELYVNVFFPFAIPRTVVLAAFAK